MPRRPPAAEFAVPADLEPMYATLGGEVPAEAGWAFEPKYDGVRVLAVRRSILLYREHSS